MRLQQCSIDVENDGTTSQPLQNILIQHKPPQKLNAKSFAKHVNETKICTLKLTESVDLS